MTGGKGQAGELRPLPVGLEGVKKRSETWL